MGRLFHPLLFFLARCTRNELIRQIEFLHAENEILRSRLKVHHIYLSPQEQSLLFELGKAIGPALQHIITVVQYQTFLRWMRNDRKQGPKRLHGRPPTPNETRDLVVRIARETGWGYTRILGELRKLGIAKISRQTVVNILKAAGLEPGPKRGPGTWDEFLKIHAETLWQCDFFSKRVIKRAGFPQMFALVFLNVATRRVWVSPCTAKPTAAWVEEHVNAFLEYAGKDGVPSAGLVTRDNDKIYGEAFDLHVSGEGR